MQCETTQDVHQINLARQVIYRFLSLALSDPASRRWQRLRDPGALAAASEAAELLREAAAPPAAPAAECAIAPGELPPERLDLSGVIRLLRDPAFDAEVEYQRAFGLMMSKKHPPYESEYCPQTFSVYRAQVIADVAGFYGAFGLEPSRDAPERQDHIGLELEFLAWLLFKESRAAGEPGPEARQKAELCAAAARRFFRQHVAWWVPAFANALRERERARGASDGGYYSALADALAAFVYIERTLTDTPAPTELVAPQATEDADPACGQGCATGP